MNWWNPTELWSSCSKMNPNHVLIGLVPCEVKTVYMCLMYGFTKAHVSETRVSTSYSYDQWCIVCFACLAALVPRGSNNATQVLGICPRRCPGHHRKDPQHCCQDLPSNFLGWRSARVNWSWKLHGEGDMKTQHSFFIPWSFSSWVHIEVRAKFCFFRMSTLCHQHQSRFPPRNFQEYPQYPLLKLFCNVLYTAPQFFNWDALGLSEIIQLVRCNIFIWTIDQM